MPTKEELQQWAREEAQAKGIPEAKFLGLIGGESGWNPQAVNPTSGAAGLGQFLPSTARGYGVTPEQLRNDPRLALRMAATLVSDNARMFNGDYDKAIAAYFIGPGNIQGAEREGGADWLAAADRRALQYNQGTVSDFFRSHNIDLGYEPPVVQGRRGASAPMNPGGGGGMPELPAGYTWEIEGSLASKLDPKTGKYIYVEWTEPGNYDAAGRVTPGGGYDIAGARQSGGWKPAGALPQPTSAAEQRPQGAFKESELLAFPGAKPIGPGVIQAGGRDYIRQPDGNYDIAGAAAASRPQGAFTEAELKNYPGAKPLGPGVYQINGREYRRQPDGNYEISGVTPREGPEEPAYLANARAVQELFGDSGPGFAAPAPGAAPAAGRTTTAPAADSFATTPEADAAAGLPRNISQPGVTGFRGSQVETGPDMFGNPSQVAGAWLPNTQGGGSQFVTPEWSAMMLKSRNVVPSGDFARDMNALNALNTFAADARQAGMSPEAIGRAFDAANLGVTNEQRAASLRTLNSRAADELGAAQQSTKPGANLLTASQASKLLAPPKEEEDIYLQARGGRNYAGDSGGGFASAAPAPTGARASSGFTTSNPVAMVDTGTGRTRAIAGEAGPERIDVTPQARITNRATGGRSTMPNFPGMAAADTAPGFLLNNTTDRFMSGLLRNAAQERANAELAGTPGLQGWQVANLADQYFRGVDRTALNNQVMANPWVNPAAGPGWARDAIAGRSFATWPQVGNEFPRGGLPWTNANDRWWEPTYMQAEGGTNFAGYDMEEDSFGGNNKMFSGGAPADVVRPFGPTGRTADASVAPIPSPTGNFSGSVNLPTAPQATSTVLNTPSPPLPNPITPTPEPTPNTYAWTGNPALRGAPEGGFVEPYHDPNGEYIRWLNYWGGNPENERPSIGSYTEWAQFERILRQRVLQELLGTAEDYNTGGNTNTLRLLQWGRPDFARRRGVTAMAGGGTIFAGEDFAPAASAVKGGELMPEMSDKARRAMAVLSR